MDLEEAKQLLNEAVLSMAWPPCVDLTDWSGDGGNGELPATLLQDCADENGRHYYCPLVIRQKAATPPEAIAGWMQYMTECLSIGTGQWIAWRLTPEIKAIHDPATDRIMWHVDCRGYVPIKPFFPGRRTSP